MVTEPFRARGISVGMNSSRWLVLAALLATSACFRPVSTEDAPCPCASGFECCAATQRCAPTGTCSARDDGGAADGAVTLASLPLVTDDVAPVSTLLQGLAPPARLALVGTSAYVLARPSSVCGGRVDRPSRRSLTKLDFAAGAWALAWSTLLPVTGEDFKLIATSEGATISGTGQTDAEAARGGTEAFVVRVRPDGTVGWVQRFATLLDDSAHALLARPGGKVIVAGGTAGALNGNASQGSVDVFLAQLAPDGAIEWTRQAGSSSDDVAQALTELDANTFVVSGYTRGQLVPGVPLVDYALFLSQYDGSGTATWTKQYDIVSASLSPVAVARWGTGLVVADVDRFSFVSRIHADGTKDWVQTSMPESFGLGALTALDANEVSLHGLRHISTNLGPGIYPSYNLSERRISADGGVTETPGLSGWPRQSNMVWSPMLAHHADGSWVLAGAGTTYTTKDLFSVTTFAASGATRLRGGDWRFDGPTYLSGLDSDSQATVDALDMAVAADDSVVILAKVATSDCMLGLPLPGRVGIFRLPR